MEHKKWLQEGYCPIDHYHCLMPVEYCGEESDGEVQEYRKSKMVCRHALAGKCDNIQECEFFQQAPEVLGKDANWTE